MEAPQGWGAVTAGGPTATAVDPALETVAHSKAAQIPAQQLRRRKHKIRIHSWAWLSAMVKAHCISWCHPCSVPLKTGPTPLPSLLCFIFYQQQFQMMASLLKFLLALYYVLPGEVEMLQNLQATFCCKDFCFTLSCAVPFIIDTDGLAAFGLWKRPLMNCTILFCSAYFMSY